MSGTPLVVVGVDGSSCSLEALKYAVDEAKRRGAHLRIVSAWSLPPMTYAGGLAAGVDSTVFREAAEAASADAVTQARQTDAGLVIDAVVPEQSPTAALLEAAEGADLLVVGSRGHGGFASLLLGSVSTQLAQHAPCPITIIHSGKSA
jgi:nucleotide-binding universal stress UspA family protein